MPDPTPTTMRALVVTSTATPPTVRTVPTPTAYPGSAIIRILSAGVLSYTRDIYNSKRQHAFPTPLIPGSSAIGQIVSTGPDATKLKPGDLVLIDPIIHSRDGDDVFLGGIHQGATEGSAKLMREVWRDGTYAEFCRAPLENLHALNEERLTGKEGGGWEYELGQLTYIATLLVPYGGLKDISLQAGETVVIAPATGPFGGAGVLVALAMCAKVLAMGRNQDSLAKLKARINMPGRLETVPITGDVMHDCKALQTAAGGEIDAYLDIGPTEAWESTHIKSAVLSLRQRGRVSLMGGYRQDVAIPHVVVMHRNLRLQGKWMCERSDVKDMLKMVETGVLDLSVCEVVGEFGLGDWKQAWDLAAESAGFAKVVVLEP